MALRRYVPLGVSFAALEIEVAVDDAKSTIRSNGARNRFTETTIDRKVSRISRALMPPKSSSAYSRFGTMRSVL